MGHATVFLFGRFCSPFSSLPVPLWSSPFVVLFRSAPLSFCFRAHAVVKRRHIHTVRTRRQSRPHREKKTSTARGRASPQSAPKFDKSRPQSSPQTTPNAPKVFSSPQNLRTISQNGPVSVALSGTFHRQVCWRVGWLAWVARGVLLCLFVFNFGFFSINRKIMCTSAPKRKLPSSRQL